MGKGSGGGRAASAETDLSREQARIAREIFERTRGLRGGLIGGAERRLGLPMTQLDEFGQPIAQSDVALFGPRAPEREALELGFTGARENILSRVPGRGGQMNRILSDLEIDRARSIGGMEAQATREAVDIASGAAFTAPSQAITGLGAAAGGFGRALDRQSQQETGKGQGIGQLLGTFVSGGALMGSAKKLAGCWIALALYGDGMRFRLARSWIFDHWEGRVATVIQNAYLIVGPIIGRIIQRSKITRNLIKPLFDLAVKKELELMRNG